MKFTMLGEYSERAKTFYEQELSETFLGKIKMIYIDPPYNTGAKDWKYNNDYVDGNDLFRHSKWLSMMNVRLQIAKKLLKL